jgi:hypothetical protein
MKISFVDVGGILFGLLSYCKLLMVLGVAELKVLENFV